MKPILFNTEMVLAILDGRKTVTRRVMKPQPCEGHGPVKFIRWFHRDWFTTLARFGDDMSAALCDRKSPYQPGDILYVRETWAPMIDYIDGKPVTRYAYRASVEDYYRYSNMGTPITGWHPSIHMPKEAARLFLRVTGVRVERLQEINGNDMEKEGIKTGITHFKSQINNFGNADRFQMAIKEFSSLWDSTIKPADRPLYGWSANPWVWVIEFERVSGEEALGGGGDVR